MITFHRDPFDFELFNDLISYLIPFMIFESEMNNPFKSKNNGKDVLKIVELW